MRNFIRLIAALLGALYVLALPWLFMLGAFWSEADGAHDNSSLHAWSMIGLFTLVPGMVIFAIVVLVFRVTRPARRPEPRSKAPGNPLS
jgi:hypothetical protein